MKGKQRNKGAPLYTNKDETKAEKLRKKMESALDGLPEKMKNQRKEVIKEVEQAKDNLLFKTVERTRTVMSIENRKLMENWVDNIYHPNYSQVEAPVVGTKWKAPEQQHQFFYEHNPGFRHNIDLDLAQQSSAKRMVALKKLYFDYKNQATFKKGQRLNAAMSAPKKPEEYSFAYG